MKTKTASNSDLERRASEVLTNLFAQVPGLKIQQVDVELPIRPISYPEVGTVQHRHYRPDIEITVAVANERESNSSEIPTAYWHLYVEVTGQVNERILRSITTYTQGLPDATPMLFVPHLSTDVLEKCRSIKLCCADVAGNCWITLGNRVYIERMGNKSPTVKKDHSVPPLSSPKTENVLRVLLNEVGVAQRVWHIQPLATEANVSVGQAARVKEILDEMGVITEQSPHRKVGGFRLTQPEEVLQEWAGYVRSRNYHSGKEYTFHAIDSPLELQRMLTRKLPSLVTDRFALSGQQAADFYAPYTRSPIFSAYVIPDDVIDLSTLEEAMDLDSVTSGINVTLTIPRDPGIFYLPLDLRQSAREARIMASKVPVVSPVQTYLDLQRLGGRAREGAQYLMEQYLHPRWQKEITNDD